MKPRVFRPPAHLREAAEQAPPAAAKRKVMRPKIPAQQVTPGNGKTIKLDPRQTDFLEQAAPQQSAGTPANQLQRLGRGFRIGFGSLGDDRKITGEPRDKLAKSVDTDDDRLKLAKRLYAKHEALQDLATARGAVDRAFHSQTVEYPDRGVRLFMLDASKVDFENGTPEQIEKAIAEQLQGFIEHMNKYREAYRQAVLKLQASWPSVLEAARKKLRELFNADEYPSARELPEKLYCTLEPLNLTISPECQNLPPAMRAEIVRLYETKFEQAAKMQEEYVVELFSKNIADMIESIKNYDATKDSDPKKKTFFTDATVFKVHSAWEEFRDKALKYGILKGTKLQTAFEQALGTMRQISGTKEALPELLRTDRSARQKLVSQMSKVAETIGSLATAKGKRHLILE